MQELVCYIMAVGTGLGIGFTIGLIYANRTKPNGLPTVKNRPHIKGRHDK